jgi:hypothetical protein
MQRCTLFSEEGGALLFFIQFKKIIKVPKEFHRLFNYPKKLYAYISCKIIFTVRKMMHFVILIHMYMMSKMQKSYIDFL